MEDKVLCPDLECSHTFITPTNCDRNDELTLRWLTNDGLQRLPQSRRESSSSSTDDDLDDSGLVEMGARWTSKSLWHDGLLSVQPRLMTSTDTQSNGFAYV